MSQEDGATRHKLQLTKRLKMKKPSIKRELILHTVAAMMLSTTSSRIRSLELAKTTGVAQPSIHYHFKSMVNLYRSAVNASTPKVAQMIRDRESIDCRSFIHEM